MKRLNRILALAVCMCMIINLNIWGPAAVYAETEASGSAAASSIESEADVMAVAGADNIDWSELSGSHDISRYEDNEAAVLYKDGRLEVLKFGSRNELEAGLAELAEDETVEIYQPNFRYKVDSQAVAEAAVTDSESDSSDTSGTAEASRVSMVLSNDRFVEAQWYLRNDGSFSGAVYPVKASRGIDIRADWAWFEYEPKRQVTVAVIDTGIDRWELDLAGRVWENTDEIQGNGIDDDGNGYIDDHWGWNFFDNNNIICKGSEDDHGTHCASVIAAKADNGYGIKGIAHSDAVKVMAVKALGGKEGHGTTDSLVAAIEYAEDNGAQICNFSLGTETDDFILKKAVLGSKMLFVAAAGNSTGINIKGVNIDYHATYPAAYGFRNVITVANLAADGRLHTSSDYGVKTVHLAAPGTDIAGATVGDGFVYMTGTSMAAPMVTAAAALIYSSTEHMSVLEVKDCILNHVRPLASLKGYVSTGGMLDIAAAVKYAVNIEEQSLKSDKDTDNKGENATDTGGSADRDTACGDGEAVGDSPGSSSEAGTDDTGVKDSDDGKLAVRIPFIDNEIEIELPVWFKGLFEKIMQFGRRLF